MYKDSNLKTIDSQDVVPSPGTNGSDKRVLQATYLYMTFSADRVASNVFNLSWAGKKSFEKSLV